jgi:release factor glutamine methyltransferase
MMSLLDVLKRTEAWLRERGVDSPRLDAERLIGHVLGIERLRLYLMFDRPMSDDELAALRPLMRRRGQREPLAYILGSRGFHDIDLIVRPGVLVPRPDTEALVDAALEWFGTSEEPLFVADVGSGSGAVGLAIAHALPSVRVYAIDVSPDALAVTRENVTALGLTDRVGVLRGSMLNPVPTSRAIDWVVSNPPYIASRIIPTLQVEVARYEPRLALDGGRDGLDAYHALIPAARARARKGLLVEVGHDQAVAVSELFSQAGFTDVRTWKDLGGIERVVGGRIPPVNEPG